MYKRQSYITRMFQFGAMGYLLKDDRAQEIEKAIRVVLNGDRYFSSQIKIEIDSLLERDQKKEQISDRELEILECISRGLTNQDISEKLFLSQHTIETHRKNILRKLDAKNTAELIRISVEKGLI